LEYDAEFMQQMILPLPEGDNSSYPIKSVHLPQNSPKVKTGVENVHFWHKHKLSIR